MNTGFLQADVAAAFDRQRRRNTLSRFAARLQPNRAGASALLRLDEVVTGLERVRESDLGVHQIALESIVGTVDRRREDFDRKFRPRSHRARSRWLSIAAAQQRGLGMPPIEVYRISDQYFVLDGHHRVSVARAFGDTTIEAHVHLLLTAGPDHPTTSHGPERRRVRGAAWPRRAAIRTACSSPRQPSPACRG